MRAPLLIGALLTLACATPEVPDALADPERAARDFLGGHIFDEAETLRPRFAEGVKPEDFPIRLMLDGPAQFRFVDLWQQRWIDGRHVVWAIVELDGEAQRFTFWLEAREGRWLIAGWSKLLVSVDPEAPTPPDSARMPIRFASATFRGSPAVAPVPADPPPAGSRASAPPVKVRLKRPVRFEGDCPKGALRKALTQLEPALARCYGAALPESRRGGRLTFALTLDGTSGPREASLVETTLLDESLRECGVRALRTVRPEVSPKALCTLRARYVFTTPK